MTDQDIKQQNEADVETDNGNTAAADTAEKETNENPSSEVDVTNDVPEKDEKDSGDEKLSRSDKKKIRKLESRVTELEKALAASEEAKKAGDDKYLRMLAEYDNFRRRAAKEKEGIYSDAYSDAIGALLPVLDNLDRAAACTDAEALAGGLALTVKSFKETLVKLGVEEIKAEGETFDPNLHNAVMHVEDDGLGEGQIVEVFQKGYHKGDKVIRHAVVKVAN